MSGDFLALMLQSLAALGAVLALFAGLVWLVRHLQGLRLQPQNGGQLKIVQRLALDTRHSLVEITCGQSHHLIGLSPDGITSIARNIPVDRDIKQTKNNVSPSVDN